MKKHKGEPGYVCERRLPTNKGGDTFTAAVYRTALAGFVDKTPRIAGFVAAWSTRCDKHDEYGPSRNQDRARDLMKEPHQFCEGCRQDAGLTAPAPPILYAVGPREKPAGYAEDLQAAGYKVAGPITDAELDAAYPVAPLRAYRTDADRYRELVANFDAASTALAEAGRKLRSFLEAAGRVVDNEVPA